MAISMRELEEERKRKLRESGRSTPPPSTQKKEPAFEGRPRPLGGYQPEKSPLEALERRAYSPSPERAKKNAEYRTVDYEDPKTKAYTTRSRENKERMSRFNSAGVFDRADRALGSPTATVDRDVVRGINTSYGKEWREMSDHSRIKTLGDAYDAKYGDPSNPASRIRRTNWIYKQLAAIDPKWDRETSLSNRAFKSYEQYAKSAGVDLKKTRSPFADISSNPEWRSLEPAQMRAVLGQYYDSENRGSGPIDHKQRDKFIQTGIVASYGQNPWTGAEEELSAFSANPSDVLYDEKGNTRQLDRYKKMTNESLWWSSLSPEKKRFALSRDFDQTYSKELQSKGKSQAEIDQAKEDFIDTQLSITPEYAFVEGAKQYGKWTALGLAGTAGEYGKAALGAVGGYSSADPSNVQLGIQVVDKWLSASTEEQEALRKKYGARQFLPYLPVADAPGMGESIKRSAAISVPSSVLGYAAGTAAAIASAEGGPAASAFAFKGTQTLVSGATAYGLAKTMTVYDLEKELIEHERRLKNGEAIQRQLTPEVQQKWLEAIKNGDGETASKILKSVKPAEWTKADEAAVRAKYGDWINDFANAEAVPEAAGQALFDLIIPGGGAIAGKTAVGTAAKGGVVKLGPKLAAKMGEENFAIFQKALASKYAKAATGATRLAGGAAGEVPTEVATQVWQTNLGYDPRVKGTVYESQGAGPATDLSSVARAFKEVAPQTIGQTLFMGGMGSAKTAATRRGPLSLARTVNFSGPTGAQKADTKIATFNEAIKSGSASPEAIAKEAIASRKFSGEHGERVATEVTDKALDNLTSRIAAGEPVVKSKGGNLSHDTAQALAMNLTSEAQQNPTDKKTLDRAFKAQDVLLDSFEGKMNNLRPRVEAAMARVEQIQADVQAGIISAQEGEKMINKISSRKEVKNYNEFNDQVQAIRSARETISETQQKVEAAPAEQIMPQPAIVEQGVVEPQVAGVEAQIGEAPAVESTPAQPMTGQPQAVEEGLLAEGREVAAPPQAATATAPVSAEQRIAQLPQNAKFDDYVRAVAPGVEITDREQVAQLRSDYENWKSGKAAIAPEVETALGELPPNLTREQFAKQAGLDPQGAETDRAYEDYQRVQERDEVKFSKKKDEDLASTDPRKRLDAISNVLQSALEEIGMGLKKEERTPEKAQGMEFGKGGFALFDTIKKAFSPKFIYSKGGLKATEKIYMSELENNEALNEWGNTKGYRLVQQPLFRAGSQRLYDDNKITFDPSRGGKGFFGPGFYATTSSAETIEYISDGSWIYVPFMRVKKVFDLSRPSTNKSAADFLARFRKYCDKNNIQINEIAAMDNESDLRLAAQTDTSAEIKNYNIWEMMYRAAEIKEGQKGDLQAFLGKDVPTRSIDESKAIVNNFLRDEIGVDSYYITPQEYGYVKSEDGWYVSIVEDNVKMLYNSDFRNDGELFQSQNLLAEEKHLKSKEGRNNVSDELGSVEHGQVATGELGGPVEGVGQGYPGERQSGSPGRGAEKTEQRLGRDDQGRGGESALRPVGKDVAVAPSQRTERDSERSGLRRGDGKDVARSGEEVSETGGERLFSGRGARKGKSVTTPTASTSKNVQQVTDHFIKLSSRWDNGPKGGLLAFSSKDKSLPSKLSDKIKEARSKGDVIEGLYDPKTDTAYVFPDLVQPRQGESVEQASTRVALEEIMRHKGIREALGGNLEAMDRWLRDLYISKRKIINNSGIFEAYGWDQKKKNDQLKAAEEWFAHTYDPKKDGFGWIKRFKAIVKAWANNTFGSDFKFNSDEDIYMMAKKSREAVTKGKVGAALETQKENPAENPEYIKEISKLREEYDKREAEIRKDFNLEIRKVIAVYNKEVIDAGIPNNSEAVKKYNQEMRRVVTAARAEGRKNEFRYGRIASKIDDKYGVTFDDIVNANERKSQRGDGQPLFSRKPENKDIAADPIKSHLPANVAKNIVESKGLPQSQFYDNLKEKAGEASRMLRQKFIHLDYKKHSEVADSLRVLEEQPSISKSLSVRYLHDITKNLAPNEYEAFSLNLLLGDMIEDLNSGLLNENTMSELPFGFENQAQVEEAKAKVEKDIAKSPAIKEAIEAHEALFMGNEENPGLARKMVALDLLPEKVLEKKSYWHHQVLIYRQIQNMAKAVGGTGKDVRPGVEGYQMARHGSGKPYNTDYLQSYFEVLAGALTQIETQKVLNKIQDKYDAKKEAQEAADKYNNDQKGLMPATFEGKGKIEVGSKVRAMDKGNIGTVTGLDPSSNQVEVYFYNRDTRRMATKSFDISNLKVPDKGKFLSWTDVIGNPAFPKFANHMLWYDKPGGVRYNTYSVGDKLAAKIMDGAAVANADDLRKVTAVVAGEVMALPRDIAVTMNDLKAGEDVGGPFSQVASNLMAKWKQYILLNPVRALKYNLNNMSGDMDIAIAYNPQILLGMPRAMNDLLKYMRKQKMSPEVRAEMESAERSAVLNSGITAREIPDIHNIKEFRKFASSKEGSLGEKALGAMAWPIVKYFDAARGASTYRENILRLAAYRHFKQQIARGKKVYGASSMREIDAIENDDQKAAKLARELLGDYGNLTNAGNWLRKQLIPFWSWQEINMPRYARILASSGFEGNSKAATAARMALAPVRLSYTALKMAAFFGAVNVANLLWHPDEEDELGLEGLRQMHLILGRNKEGKIRTLRLQGAFSDALGWFGGENAFYDVRNLKSGEMSWDEFLEKGYKAAPNRVIGGVRPDIKTIAEMLFGYTAYPDAFNPRPIRDVWEHASRTVSGEMLYRHWKGVPTGKTLLEDLMAQATYYSTDPGLAAYYDARTLVRKFNKAKGYEDRGAPKPGTKSNHLFYYKLAVRYGDEENQRKYYELLRKDYENENKTFKSQMSEDEFDALVSGKMAEGIANSIKAGDPGDGIKPQDRKEFLESLSVRQLDRFNMGVQWFKDVYMSDEDSQYKMAARDAQDPENKGTVMHREYLKANSEIQADNKKIDLITNYQGAYYNPKTVGGQRVSWQGKDDAKNNQEKLREVGIETKIVGNKESGYHLERITPAFTPEERDRRTEPIRQHQEKIKRDFYRQYENGFDESKPTMYGQRGTANIPYKNEDSAKDFAKRMAASPDNKGKKYKVVRVTKKDGYDTNGYMVKEVAEGGK